MYTIYADGKLVHAPHFFEQGCGVFSPKLTVELNKAGSLEFTMPPSHNSYNDISKLKSVVTVFQNGEELFRGRVLHDEKDFYKQKKTYCEGELAFLLDSVQRPYTFSGNAKALFQQYINNHNARVDDTKRFTVGTIDNDFASIGVACENYNYPSTWDELSAQIIDGIGGYVQTYGVNGVRYIDLRVDSGSLNTQTIEFGKNLLDISEYITAENIFTVLIPLGGTIQPEEGEEVTEDAPSEKLTIVDVNDGKDYIENATAISLFGRIEKTQDWSEVEDADELLALGNELLSQNIEMAMTLTVKAIDLHLLEVDTQRLRLGDFVRVISLPHGLDKSFQCTKISYNLTDPDQNEYVFGVNFTSLTEQQLNDKKSIKNSVSTVMSAAGTVNATVSKANQAVVNVEQVIAQIPTDYVKTTTFEAYKSEVNDSFVSKIEFDSLVERVNNLEGGTT